MKTLIIMVTAMLWSAEAVAGTLYTYRAGDGTPLVANHALSAKEIRALGVVLQEVRFIPDSTAPRVPGDTEYPLMRASVTIGAPSSGSAGVSLPSYLQPVSIPPLAIAPVSVPAVSVPTVSVERFTIEPVTIAPIAPPAPATYTPVVTPAVTTAPVTIPSVSVPPVSFPVPGGP